MLRRKDKDKKPEEEYHIKQTETEPEIIKAIESPYIRIDEIPKSSRGKQSIPTLWIAEISNIPIGKAKTITDSDLKHSTIQNRVRKLLENKQLTGTFKVLQRTVENKKVTYVVHVN